MSSIDISVIVPVYNVASYLTQAIDSLLRQTFSNIEIILVNDCSPHAEDERICLEYVAKDSRVKYIKNDTNLGQGISRNEGLSIATGKYIAFVDSDDYLNAEALQTCYNDLESSNADILVFSYKEFSDDVNMVLNDPNYMAEKGSIVVENEDILKLFFNDSARIGYTVWNKLYKRSLIIDNHIKFLPIVYEDNAFMTEICFYAKKAILTDYIFYNYRQREGSTTTTTSHRHIDSAITVINYLYNFLQKKGIYQAFLDLFWQKHVVALLVFVIDRIVLLNNNKEEAKLTSYLVRELEQRGFLHRYLTSLSTVDLRQLFNHKAIIDQSEWVKFSYYNTSKKLKFIAKKSISVPINVFKRILNNK